MVSEFVGAITPAGGAISPAGIIRLAVGGTSIGACGSATVVGCLGLAG
jgi:hypothetical protein